MPWAEVVSNKERYISIFEPILVKEKVDMVDISPLVTHLLHDTYKEKFGCGFVDLPTQCSVRGWIKKQILIEKHPSRLVQFWSDPQLVIWSD